MISNVQIAFYVTFAHWISSKGRNSSSLDGMKSFEGLDFIGWVMW